MHGEIRIKAGETCHKVIFPDTDCTFGCILAMIVRGYELEINVILPQELFESCGAFVVQFLELGLQALVGEMLVHARVGSKKFAFGAVFDGFGKDGS